MIGDISLKTNLYIICGHTDMRRSIDGLCAIVQDMFHAQPDAASVYLFCGKRHDRIKILIKEPDGMCLSAGGKSPVFSGKYSGGKPGR